MIDTIYDSAEIAARAHHGQMRKDGVTPYIVHPGRVATLVAMMTHDYPTLDGVMAKHMIAAAWLHDVIEDTTTTEGELYREVDAAIIDLVVGLTNDKSIKAPRPDRKKMERERLEKASQAVRLIKLADRLDNVQDLEHLSDDFAKLYARETEELVFALTRGPMCMSGVRISLAIGEAIKDFL